MDRFLALEVAWVTPNGLTDDEFIEAAEMIGRGDDARERVKIYHTEFEGTRH